MRKHRIPFGWPSPDPRHCRFPLPNAIWEYDLKPTEFVILSYLCCCHSHRRNDERVSAETVAKAVHLTVDTVKKYLSSLVCRKLITDEFSLAPALQLTDDRMFFTLPNEIFLLNLPPSAFMVYAYLLLVEDRKTHTCHPSYNTIANQTGMAKNTVIKSIGVLLDAKLIAMEHSQYFDMHGMKWKAKLPARCSLTLVGYEISGPHPKFTPLKQRITPSSRQIPQSFYPCPHIPSECR